MENQKRFRKLFSPLAVIMVMILLSTTCFAAEVTDLGIYRKWLALGGQNGFLGSPTCNTSPTGDRQGVFNYFQGGTILRKFTSTDAFAVNGLIQAKYAALGWQSSALGYPITDERDAYRGTGRYNHFESGSIYYKWGDGAAFEVHGAIRALWSWTGWESGPMGFPQSDEYYVNGKAASRFEKGAIYCNSRMAWPILKTPAMSPIGGARIDIDLYQGAYGINYKISGSGFPANKRILVSGSRVCGAYPINTFTSDSNGNFYFDQTKSAYGTGYIDFAKVDKIEGVVTIFARCEDGTGPVAIDAQYANLVYPYPNSILD